MLAPKARPRTVGAAVLVVALALTLLLTGMPLGGVQQAQAAYADPTNYVIGLHTPAKITKLIYPTIGNPAIVKKGASFTVEWDPREGTFYKQGVGQIPLPTCTNFNVTVTSTNGGSGAITRALPVASARANYSTQWPLLKAGGGTDRRVYLVQVSIPNSLPADLYDLTVSCTIEGHVYSDIQTNSLDAVDQYNTKVNFIQMSDIHVYGPENPDSSLYGIPFHTFSRDERAARRTSYDASPTGQGWGATYLHKEIMEINRVHPDFCVFTGDYDFGQRYFHQNEGAPWNDSTQYEFEQSWFYQEIQALEVPVFIVIGNHDGYEYSNSFYSPKSPQDEDWLNNWTHLYSPLYYTFNYGPDNKFFAVNTMDWSGDQRALQNYLNVILQPVKYLGAVTSGGDTWLAGISQSRLNAINVNNFTGQLGWLRDQLAASQSAKIRVFAMHHDPWKDNGSGGMWASNGSSDWLGQIEGGLDMGNGPGRLSLIKLATLYHSALMIHGHDHSDCTSEDDSNKALLDWSGGGGHTISANTTSSSFQADGNSGSYPGYRRVWINNGSVIQSGNESLNYVEPYWSWPAYAGTTVGGTTNLNNLHTPAVNQVWSATPGPSTTDVTCTLTNAYNKPLTGTYMEFPMKYLDSGHWYQVENGTAAEIYDVSGSTRMTQVYTDLAASQANKAVRVHESAATDTTSPTGSVRINSGAATTTSQDVTLTMSATDTQSGVGQMMISNASSFSGASWEPYQASRAWRLSDGTGAKTVYVKFRDNAMPPNDVTKSDAITFGEDQASGPQIVTVSPSSIDASKQPGTHNITIIGQGTNFVQDTTRATFGYQGGGGSGITVNSTTVVNAGQLTANVTLSANATVGPWDVGVTGPGTIQSLPGGFTVLGPMITSVSPSHSIPGRTLNVQITGYDTQFRAATPFADFGSGITVNGMPVVTDDTHMTARISIDPGAAQGARDVTVRVGSVDYFPLRGGFTVANLSTWYLAEGTCRPGFDPYICIQNPGEAAANVKATYMKGDGTTAAQTLTVPANSRSTINVKDKLGEANDSAHDFSTKVECTNSQPIIVERPMYFNYGGAWTGGHDVVGTTFAGSTYYFAEGTCRPNFDPYICIQNPGTAAASVKVTYMKGDGTSTNQMVTVPKNARYTIRVKDKLGEANDDAHDFSARVACTNGQKIIAERPMYFNYQGYTQLNWTGGHDVVGATSPSSTFYFAEGTCRPNFDPYICIQNPGGVDAAVTITYMKGDGTTDSQTLTVKKNSRATVKVTDKLGQGDDSSHDFSSKVACTNGQVIIAERPMYFNYQGYTHLDWNGGHDAVGAVSPASEYYFAEGTGRPGFDPYICIQNPGSAAADVTITYMKGDGTTDSQALSVPANSRATVKMKDKLGEANDSAHDVSTKVECTNGQLIIAERPMYFCYNGAWTGGHDVVGFTP